MSAAAAVLCALGTLALLGCPPHLTAQDTSASESGWAGVFPSGPGAGGFSPLGLAALVERANEPGRNAHAIRVLRRDSLVFRVDLPPFDGGAHDIASVTKSVTALSVMRAVSVGLLPSLDARAVDLLSAEAAQAATPGFSAVRLRDLMDMRSGFDCDSGDEAILARLRAAADPVAFAVGLPLADRPGERFSYCSANFHILSAIVQNASGQTLAEWASEHLLGPLGIVPAGWPDDGHGTTVGWGDLVLTPADLIRLGEMLLDEGTVAGSRILPAEMVREVAGDGSATDYRLGWWRDGGQFEAVGRGGQRLTILPGLDAAVVFLGGGLDPAPLGEALGAALTEGGAPASAVVAQATERIEASLTEARRRFAPQSMAGEIPRGVRPLFDGRRRAIAENSSGITAITLDPMDGGTILIETGDSDPIQQPLAWSGGWRDGRRGPLRTIGRAGSAGEGGFTLELNLIGGIDQVAVDIFPIRDGLRLRVRPLGQGGGELLIAR